MDTAHDGGIIEYSVDNGNTWVNVFNNPYVYNFYGFQTANQDTLPGGEFAFSGTDSTWRDIWLCFDMSWLQRFNWNDTALFRFTLLSDSVAVNRADSKDRHLSIIKMVNALKAGTSIYLAPEGTRNKTKEILLPFKDGAFRMAIAAQAPICVFTLYNTDKLLNPKKLLSLLPGTIRGTWAEPIYTKGMTENDIPALREKVRNIMETNYVMMSKM